MPSSLCFIRPDSPLLAMSASGSLVGDGCRSLINGNVQMTPMEVRVGVAKRAVKCRLVQSWFFVWNCQAISPLGTHQLTLPQSSGAAFAQANNVTGFSVSLNVVLGSRRAQGNCLSLSASVLCSRRSASETPILGFTPHCAVWTRMRRASTIDMNENRISVPIIFLSRRS